MISQETRERWMLHHESQILGQRATADAEEVVIYAQCVVDGAINAILRVAGPDEAAKFAFALCDRVVAKAKQPTLLPGVPLLAEKPPVRIEAADDAIPTKVRWWHKRPAELAIWWASGFVAGFIVRGMP